MTNDQVTGGLGEGQCVWNGRSITQTRVGGRVSRKRGSGGSECKQLFQETTANSKNVIRKWFKIAKLREVLPKTQGT